MSFHQKCLICNSDNLYTLTSYNRAYLVKCNDCGFVFSKKIPTNEELISHYDGYGRNDYLSPITIKRYNEILDKLEKYRKTNKLIDVGCGIGYFLEEAKKRGWEVYGTEMTDKAVEICKQKGINIYHGELNISDFEEGSFDVVTSFEVIEHIYNPQEEAKKFNYLLRKGGLLYLTTPNFNSFSRDILKDKWSIIYYPEHLSYYTKKTINSLLSNNGFVKKCILTTGISLTRYKKSLNKSSQKLISNSSDDEKIRIKAEENIFLKLIKNIINLKLSILGKGDTIKAYFVKK